VDVSFTKTIENDHLSSIIILLLCVQSVWLFDDLTAANVYNGVYMLFFDSCDGTKNLTLVWHPVHRLSTLCVYNILKRNTRLIVYQHVHLTLRTVPAQQTVYAMWDFWRIALLHDTHVNVYIIYKCGIMEYTTNCIIIYYILSSNNIVYERSKSGRTDHDCGWTYFLQNTQCRYRSFGIYFIDDKSFKNTPHSAYQMKCWFFTNVSIISIKSLKLNTRIHSVHHHVQHILHYTIMWYLQ